MRVLVLALFAAYVSAKPTISEIPLSSYGVPITQGASYQYSSSGGSNLLSSQLSSPDFQNVQFTKQSSYGLSQPEITNAGSYGIGLSSTTASPLTLSSVLPSSTVSSLLSSDAGANINLGGVSNGNLLLNSYPSVSSAYVSDFSSAAPSVSGLNLGVNPSVSSFNLGSVSPSVSSFNLGSVTPSVSTFNVESVNPTVSTVVSQSVPDVQVGFGLNQNLVQPSVTKTLVAPLVNPGYASYNYKQSVSSVPTVQTQFLNNQVLNRNSYYESNYQYNNSQAPIVSKHLYYFEAPQDFEEVRARKVVQVAPPQKTYKVIFIKAPSAPELGPIDIPVQSQNEEKTVVYVLSKKPETEQQVRVHSSSTLKQSKPEVFFIKYSNKEEAEKAILDAQAGLGSGAVGSAYGDASQLVSSISQQELRSLQNKQLRQQEFEQQIQNEQVLSQQNQQQSQDFSSLRFGGPVVNKVYESSTALPLVSSTPVVQFGGPLTQTVKTVKIESAPLSSLSGNLVNTVGYQSGSLPVTSFSGLKTIESSTALPLTSGSFATSGLNQFQSGLNAPFVSGNYQVKYGSTYTPVNTVYKTTSYQSARPVQTGFSSFNTGSNVYSASSNVSPLKVNTEYLPSFGANFNLVSQGAVRSREEQSELANVQDFDNKNSEEQKEQVLTQTEVTGSDEGNKFTTLFGSNLAQVNTLTAGEASSEIAKNQDSISTTLKNL